MSLSKRKPEGYWDLKTISIEALKYNTRFEFQKKCCSAYAKAGILGIKDIVCSHMRISSSNYSLEDCRKKALLCKTKSEFRSKYNLDYNRCIKRGWMGFVSSHFNVVGSKHSRLVYVYSFKESNSVYIGLTYNIAQRNHHHMNIAGSVFNHIQSTGEKPVLTLASDYVNASVAACLEIELVEVYKKNGYKVLNKARAGALGAGDSIWSEAKLKDTMSKYESYAEFRRENRGGVAYAIKNNIKLSNIAPYPIRVPKPNGFWGFEECKKAATGYSSKVEFYNANSHAYKICLKNNWLNDFFEPTIRKNKKR